MECTCSEGRPLFHRFFLSVLFGLFSLCPHHVPPYFLVSTKKVFAMCSLLRHHKISAGESCQHRSIELIHIPQNESPRKAVIVSYKAQNPQK